MIEILILLAGALLGWQIREWYATLVVRKLEKHILKHIKENMAKNVFIEISKLGEDFHVHNKETGEFLAQGKTQEDVIGRLRKRFPDITFIAINDQANDIGFKNDTF